MQMKKFETRRTTLELPRKLLESALQETGEGISKTVAAGLEKIVASRGYKKLLSLEGKIDLEIDISELREDRILK